MSLLEELNILLEPLGTPVETSVFTAAAPETYIVITPISDIFEMYADNQPYFETQEAQLSLFSKGSYTALKNRLVKALLGADFTITDRRYIGFEESAGYHHYAIDVARNYELKEDE
ncbi:hypothetical protein HNQ56_001637 [Anaerotaenia torta]|uniref:hypothetical protein n=1 Tax=Anaerotaenia torta TaxID=433293 RepID=UPI003D1BBB53